MPSKSAKSRTTAAHKARITPNKPKVRRSRPSPGVAQQQSKQADRRRAAPRPSSKAAAVLAALQQPAGATLEELTQATGWQAHSVRGFLSGTVRKKLGLEVVSDPGPTGRRYRVTTPAENRGTSR